MTPRPLPAGVPQRTLITSRAELDAALLLLIGRAHRRLCFAASDLSILALGGVQPVAALHAVLLAHPDNRIQMLVDDMSWLDRNAPRLRSLQRDFSHSLLIRCADPQDPVEQEAVAIGDDLDALRLQPTIGITGEMWCNNFPFVQPLLAAFERRWEHAAHNQPASPLGL